MKKTIKSEEILQLLVNVEAEMEEYNSEAGTDEYFGGKADALFEVATSLKIILGIEDLEIEVELEDEDD